MVGTNKRPAVALQTSSKRGRSMEDVCHMPRVKRLALGLPTSRDRASRQQRKLRVEKEERKKARRVLRKEAEQKVERAMREEGESERISAWIEAVPECPVFKPTREQFKDPLKYIKSLETQVKSRYGICKIIPPYVNKVFCGREQFRDSRFTMEVRQQPLKMVDWEKKNKVIKAAEFNKDKKIWTFKEFEEFANEFVQREYEGSSSQLQLRFIEREFWTEFLLRRNKHVRYASDVPGTAFDAFEELSKSDWNLGELPSLADSVLRNVSADIPGVTKPMLYVGMLFSMFAWHVEDHYLYSINYHHLGAPKTWYGVPGCAAQAFERVAAEKVFGRPLDDNSGESMARTLRLLIGKTIMFPPGLLVDAGVPVCRAVQQPGEFVVTFPRSYHAGFSNGFNCGEAVNFALADWFPYGVACARRYRLLKQVNVVAHDELLCKEARDLHARMKEPDFELNELAVHTMVEFVRLLQWQHRQLWALQQRGVAAEPMDELEGASMECALCLHKTYLAHVVCDCTKGAPICFNHSDLLRACRCPAGTAATSRRLVAYLTALPLLTSIAQEFDAYPGIPERVEAAAQAELTSPSELADEWQLCGLREEPMGELPALCSIEEEAHISTYEPQVPIMGYQHEDAEGVRSLQPGTPPQLEGDALAGGLQNNSREGSPESVESKLTSVPFACPLESALQAAEVLMRAVSSSSQAKSMGEQEAPALRRPEGVAAESDAIAAPESKQAFLEISKQERGSQNGQEAGQEAGTAGRAQEVSIGDRTAEAARRQASSSADAMAELRSKSDRDSVMNGEQIGVAKAGEEQVSAAVAVVAAELPTRQDALTGSGTGAPESAAALLRETSNGQASREREASLGTVSDFADEMDNGGEAAGLLDDRVAPDGAAQGMDSNLHTVDDVVGVARATVAEKEHAESLDGSSVEERERQAGGQQGGGGTSDAAAKNPGPQQCLLPKAKPGDQLAPEAKREREKAKAERVEQLLRMEGAPRKSDPVWNVMYVNKPQFQEEVGRRKARWYFSVQDKLEGRRVVVSSKSLWIAVDRALRAADRKPPPEDWKVKIAHAYELERQAKDT